MFHPISWYIGLRYTRAKRSNHFISFIAGSSMIGIALGVAVLITVLSVMNGFDQQIQQRFFSMANQITIRQAENKMLDWEKHAQPILENPEVIGAAPFISGQGMLNYQGQNAAAFLMGIDPNYEDQVSELSQKMVAGRLSDLQEKHFGLVVGRTMANQLGLMLGDKVNILIPQVSVTPVGVIPRFKRFTVVGIFQAGSGFGFDSKYAFLYLPDAQKLFAMGDAVSGFRLKLHNIYQAPRLSYQFVQNLPEDMFVTNWTQNYGALFKALRMEKTMMFVILTLIIAVAAFNLVSSLVMVVTDKQSDIAILRTYGATPKMILRIFMVQGFVIGLFGTVIGVIGGILLALNATDIVDALQKFFQVQILSSNVYFVDYLPSSLHWLDVVKVACVAGFLAFLATLYPAWRASKVHPAEALRYE